MKKLLALIVTAMLLTGCMTANMLEKEVSCPG
jgi:predicted small secreted protein